MKHRCPGVALVFLAVLWLLASGSQPPGCKDCSMLRSQQGLVLPSNRTRRSTIKSSCPSGMSWIRSVGRCCTQCPPGTFLQTPCTSHGNDNVCVACPAGTFLSHPNTRPKCDACYTCDHQMTSPARSARPALGSCFYSPVSVSTQPMGCHLQGLHWPDMHPLPRLRQARRTVWELQARLLCRGQRVPPVPHVSSSRGGCAGNRHSAHHPSPCRSTPETCGEECQRVCGHRAPGSGLEYILLGLTGPLFLGALAIYHKRKRLQMETPAISPLPTATPWDCSGPTACMHPVTQRAAATEVMQCQVWEPGSSMARRSSESSALLHQQPSRAALPNGTTEPSVPSTAHSPAPPLSSPQRCALLQGSQLYAVINAVPVRRWKEFMRVLELRDTEIELVEMEVAPFRDRQYEMLKRWCQQTSATLDRIFAALEHMDLSGCAETLRQSLALGP
ncbi:tumor necrosis factor receptor superfamily member 25 isoform X1 [Lagopus muta]|uniref:tumor necrosis factor receptor superfamily member 25 isoform X1 n=1 Tax=Lagopus muta TaxID=64668 RepID=UPI00209E419F|nr:tumor necrosis factor receptor superfamily member 25 isoform X1 [Lagopus muta]